MGIGRLLPAALGIGIPTMMQVGPDDAILNLCKWPRKLWPDLPQNCLPGISSVWLYVAAGLLIIGSILWFAWPHLPAVRRRNGSTRIKPEQDGPIQWTWDFILAARWVDPGIQIYGFQAIGQNTSNEFISGIGGFVRSDITGRQFPILVRDRNELVPTADYGIPAKHQFHLGANFVDTGGFTPTRFLQDFGRLTFSFEYNGKTYKRHFTHDEIASEIRRAEDFLRPKVSPSQAGVRRISHEPSVNAAIPFVKLERTWRPATAAEDIVSCFKITATSHASDVAFIARYAEAIHYISSVEWKWSGSLRINQIAQIFPSENWEIEAIRRPRSGKNIVILFDKITHKIRDDALILMRLDVVSSGRTERIQFAYHLRSINGANLLDPVHLDDIAYIKGIDPDNAEAR
ncbi:hypothetical protein [Afipia sp. P52-10]|uniref:hypothetical protein n=1 Tax=Afipia sp. P52-10 TaxID=1429916 RepID=UPI0004B7EC05|nr:hypothetical protein [Afipia sp. P52-10]